MKQLGDINKYSNPKPTASWFDGSLYVYCSGSSGASEFVDDHLSIEWKSLLPIYQDCRAHDALPLARTKRSNGAVNVHRAQHNRLTADDPRAHVDIVTLMQATRMTLVTTSRQSCYTKRTICSTSPITDPYLSPLLSTNYGHHA